MSTLTGVIKAATRLGISVTPTESDLWVDVDFLYISSTLYPIEFIDRAATSSVSVEVRHRRSPIELAETSGSVSRVTKIRQVKYLDYINPPELAETTGNVSRVTKVHLVRYLDYTNPPELAETSGSVSGVTKIRSAGYITYVNEPDLAETSASVGKITKWRQI